MQIHELNKQLDEGLYDAWQDAKAGYQALKQPGGLKALGKGIATMGIARGDWDKRVAAAANQPRVQQLAQTMAQQWSQLADQIEATPAPAQPATAQPAQAKPTTLKQKVQAQQAKKPAQPAGAPAQQTPTTTPTGGMNLSTVKAAPPAGAPTPAERANLEKRIAAAQAKPVTEVVAKVGTWSNEQYKQRFVQWFNTMLARTQISFDQLKSEMPQMGSQIEGLINDVVYLRNSTQQQKKVAELMEKALAAVTALRQQQKVQGTEPEAPALQPATVAQQAPALLTQLAKSGAQIRSTGNPAVDQVLTSLGFRI